MTPDTLIDPVVLSSFQNLIESSVPPESTPLLRLIGFALRKSGSDARPLSQNSTDLKELLDHNNVISRQIALPTLLGKKEYPTLILQLEDRTKYCVLFRENASTYIYDPYANQISLYESHIQFGDIVFEIFPSLPHSISNGFQIGRAHV